MTVDENKSWYIEENIEMFTDLNPEEALNDENFINANQMKGTCCVQAHKHDICTFFFPLPSIFLLPI